MNATVAAFFVTLALAPYPAMASQNSVALQIVATPITGITGTPLVSDASAEAISNTIKEFFGSNLTLPASVHISPVAEHLPAAMPSAHTKPVSQHLRVAMPSARITPVSKHLLAAMPSTHTPSSSPRHVAQTKQQQPNVAAKSMRSSRTRQSWIFVTPKQTALVKTVLANSQKKSETTLKSATNARRENVAPKTESPPKLESPLGHAPTPPDAKPVTLAHSAPGKAHVQPQVDSSAASDTSPKGIVLPSAHSVVRRVVPVFHVPTDSENIKKSTSDHHGTMITPSQTSQRSYHSKQEPVVLDIKPAHHAELSEDVVAARESALEAEIVDLKAKLTSTPPPVAHRSAKTAASEEILDVSSIASEGSRFLANMASFADAGPDYNIPHLNVDAQQRMLTSMEPVVSDRSIKEKKSLQTQATEKPTPSLTSIYGLAAVPVAQHQIEDGSAKVGFVSWLVAAIAHRFYCFLGCSDDYLSRAISAPATPSWQFSIPRQDPDRTEVDARADELSDLSIQDAWLKQEYEDDAIVEQVKREDRALKLEAEIQHGVTLPPGEQRFREHIGSTHISDFWANLADEDGQIEEALERGGEELTEYERLVSRQDAKVAAAVSDIVGPLGERLRVGAKTRLRQPVAPTS